MQSAQSPNAVIMVRPHHFHPNPMSLCDNVFQKSAKPDEYKHIAHLAYEEVSKAAQTLIDLGIIVHIFDDTGHITPDSIFPNNWFSTHANGDVALYPMYVPNRRKERRTDIIDMLKSKYQVHNVHDYSDLENQNIFLEGTGAMVLDHDNHIAYAARSNRAHKSAFARFCKEFSYHPYMFDAYDKSGAAVYHTNVMMCIGSDFALVGLDMVSDENERQKLRQKLEQSGKEVIALHEDQIFQFAGNAIELSGELSGTSEQTLNQKKNRHLIMSQTSHNALDKEQIAAIERYVNIVPIDVKTAEMAGGSIRCMIAGVHLQPKEK